MSLHSRLITGNTGMNELSSENIIWKAFALKNNLQYSYQYTGLLSAHIKG